MDTANFQLDDHLLGSYPSTMYQKYSFLPFFREGEHLVVLADESTDLRTLQGAVGCKVRLHQVPGDQLRNLLKGYLSAVKDQLPEDPQSALLESIISAAIARNASDIHLVPARHCVQVHYRIDGALILEMEYPDHRMEELVGRVKIKANLKIDEKRRPQDGSFEFSYQGENLDIRVALLPTIYGECAVLRLLRGQQLFGSLDTLGFSSVQYDLLKSQLQGMHGLILVVGPTGSGKTTTLYHLLSTFKQSNCSIMTLEDPVEYKLDFARQSQVQPGIGLDFAAGLRALMRQDPDIIMVGEIRDRETASIAVSAANTGHLVFSTLHTNEPSGAVSRLLEMGVEPYLIRDNLKMIIGQRLLRSLCPQCLQWEQMVNEYNLDKLPNSAGCLSCHNLGFNGRTAVFELIPVSALCSENINMYGLPIGEIKKIMAGKGLLTLRHSALELVKKGKVSLAEVLAKTPE